VDVSYIWSLEENSKSLASPNKERKNKALPNFWLLSSAKGQ